MSSFRVSASTHPLTTYLRDENATIENEYLQLKKYFPSRKFEIPDSFNGREIWRGLLTPVMNQGSCGSCWS
jgi:hypothetical protein